MKNPDKYFLAFVAFGVTALLSITAIFFHDCAPLLLVTVIPAILFEIKHHQKK